MDIQESLGNTAGNATLSEIDNQSNVASSPTQQEINDLQKQASSPLPGAEEFEEGMDDPEARDRNLIVNYLPPLLTETGLRNLFAPYGELENVKLMKDKITGNSLCYGFVKFSTPEAAELAISGVNGQQLENKILKVSLARPPSELPKQRNVYIAQLPKEYGEAELQQLASPFGATVEVKVLRDKQTNESKGCGFVQFDSHEGAIGCVNRLNNTLLAGAVKPLTVRLAETAAEKIRRKTVQQGGGMMRVNSPLSTVRFHPYSYATPGNVAMPFEYPYMASQSIASQQPTATGASESNDGVVMNNAVRENPASGVEATATAAHSNGVVAGVDAYAQYLGQYTGHYGYSQAPAAAPFTTPYDSTQAVYYQQGMGQKQVSNYSQMGYQMHPGNMGVAGNVAAAAATTESYCLFVFNLPKDSNESTLYRMFSPFGAIVNVKVVSEPGTGQCKGYGFINFARYEDACNAIKEMNGQSVGGGKPLQVSFKTANQKRQR